MDLHSTQPLASNSALPVSDSVRCGKSGKRGGGVAVTNHSYANFNIWHGLHPHPAKPAAAGAYGNATRSPFMIWARLAVSTSDRPHRMLKYYVESREKGEKYCSLACSMEHCATLRFCLPHFTLVLGFSPRGIYAIKWTL